MVETIPCFHAVSETEATTRWERAERLLDEVSEGDDLATQMSVLQWCACCCGPAKAELCSRCQGVTPEEYAALMGMRAEKAGAA